jgi:hypothetical protein
LLKKGEREEARKLLREANARLDNPPGDRLRDKIARLQSSL